MEDSNETSTFALDNIVNVATSTLSVRLDESFNDRFLILGDLQRVERFIIPFNIVNAGDREFEPKPREQY